MCVGRLGGHRNEAQPAVLNESFQLEEDICLPTQKKLFYDETEDCLETAAGRIITGMTAEELLG